MEPVIEFAMQTPDGAWRVELVKRGSARWYRIVHGDSELEWLTIAAVQRILGDAGIDIGDLTDVVDAPSGNARPGAA